MNTYAIWTEFQKEQERYVARIKEEVMGMLRKHGLDGDIVYNSFSHGLLKGRFEIIHSPEEDHSIECRLAVRPYTKRGQFSVKVVPVMSLVSYGYRTDEDTEKMILKNTRKA